MSQVLSISEKIRSLTVEEEVLDIISFTTSSQGLGMKTLYPAQKFFLKILVGEELDDTIEEIQIKDMFGQHVLQTYTQRGYFEYLRNENRISTTYEDYLQYKDDVLEYVFCMGRRASKSTMISIFIAYKLYLLLLNKSPQTYLNVTKDARLGVVLVGLSGDNAAKLFDTFISLVKSSGFFKKHILEDPNKTSVKFWSLESLENIKKAKTDIKSSYTIEVSSTVVSPSVRGSSNIFVVFDEFAHFSDSPNSTRDKPLDAAIYEALSPSVSSFTTPDGKPYGRIFTISSPKGDKNMFYKKLEGAMSDSIKETYTIYCNAPTWEVNPKVSTSFYKKAFKDGEGLYAQEYGAQIVEGGLNWIRNMDNFYFCIDPTLPYKECECRDLSKRYFMGLDFGLSKDGTSLCIGHYEPAVLRPLKSFTQEAFVHNEGLKDKIEGVKLTDVFVIDHIKYFKPGLDEFEGYKTLDIDIIIDYIEHCFKKFPIHYGIYDQWSGQIIKDILEKRGLGKQIEMIGHTQSINDSQYKLFSQLLNSNKLILPNDKGIIKELLGLKVDYNANGTIKVENQQGHDDVFDSIIRALICCWEFHMKPKGTSSLLITSNIYNNKNYEVIKRTSQRVISKHNSYSKNRHR